MLAGDLSYFKTQQDQLVRSFLERYGGELFEGRRGLAEAMGVAAPEEASGCSVAAATRDAGREEVEEVTLAAPALVPSCLPLQWVTRPVARRFGRVLSGDMAMCKQVHCDSHSSCITIGERKASYNHIGLHLLGPGS